MSTSQYGLGAGFFFVGYVTAQLPSNMLLSRVGCRTVLGTLAILWGIVGTAMAWTSSLTMFYLLRLGLGLCEAGFFPGLIIYLRVFFQDKEFAFAYSVIISATSCACILGGPLAAGVRALSSCPTDDNGCGLHAWQVWHAVRSGACRALVERLSSACRALVGRLSGACRALVGRLSGACRALVERLSSACRALVGRLLGACRARAPFPPDAFSRTSGAYIYCKQLTHSLTHSLARALPRSLTRW